MGSRITSHSRFRFDLPFGQESRADPDTLDTEGAVGLMTWAQYVEMFWRVAKIRFSGEVVVSFTHVIPDTGGTRGTSSVTAEFDVTMTRQSIEGTFPTFTEVTSDEGNVLLDNLYLGGVAAFRHDDGSIEFEIFEHLIDPDGYFWTKPTINVPVPTVFGDEPTIVIVGGHMPKSNEGMSEWDYSDESFTLPLSNGSVTFPMLVTAVASGGTRELDDAFITSVTGSVEIVEWLPYSDRAGLAAWDITTGLAANGGPGG